MDNEMSIIAKKLNITDVDVKPPYLAVRDIADKIENETQGYLKCVVQAYNGSLDSYEMSVLGSLSGLLDIRKPQRHDIQEDLGPIGYEYHNFELFVTAVHLPHYKFRILLFGYGIGGYPVKVVLEERIANSIHLPSYIVSAKNKNELNNITYKALTSPKTIEIMQDLINATLIKKANATTEEENEENKESQT